MVIVNDPAQASRRPAAPRMAAQDRSVDGKAAQDKASIQIQKQQRAARSRGWSVGSVRRVRRVSRSYSLFVRFLKWLLPLAVCTMVAAVAVWPRLNPPEDFTVEAIDPSLIGNTTQQMIKPVYRGVDESRQPYGIQSSTAIQSQVVEGAVELDRPEAVLRMSDGSTLYLQSDVGMYDRDGEALELFGGVILSHQADGVHDMQTDMAHVDLANRTAESVNAVTGVGPVGSLQADLGFEVIDGGARIVFRGPAKLILNGGAGDLAGR